MKGPCVVAAVASVMFGGSGTAGAASCAPGAFLTFEQGKLAAVDWIEYGAGRIHTKVIENQSHIVDATIDLRPDGTASHSSVSVSAAGDDGMAMAQARDLGEGAIYWSPRIASALEQAVTRARVMNVPSAKIPGASLYREMRDDIGVDRVDAVDWVVQYAGRKYLVLSDEQGCMLSATLPEYGLAIERRAEFAPAQYPLWAPYAPPPDRAYSAADVAIRAPKGHVLAGTLTRPSAKQAVPAAVLITGLSPHERNNGDAPWMPFRDIADALTRAGIAVLRVDDRGVGQSTGDHKTMTIADKVDDVRTEVAWLRAQPGIDAKRIELVGYSEGGLIAPMVAAADASIAAVVTLAGPGVPGMELARYQVEQPILRDPSVGEAQRQQEIEKQFKEALTDLSPHEQTFLAVDPLEYDRRVHCPALVVQGAADAHVPLRSAERLAEAMRGSGNRDVSVRIFPGVSHSLLPDPSGLSSGWAGLPGFLTAPALLAEVVAWSVARLAS
jgi:uncharacterized protein